MYHYSVQYTCYNRGRSHSVTVPARPSLQAAAQGARQEEKSESVRACAPRGGVVWLRPEGGVEDGHGKGDSLRGRDESHSAPQYDVDVAQRFELYREWN